MNWNDNVIMYWGTDKVSDHGRSPLAVESERIERKERMIDGTMRKYVVAIKHTFSCSWENLPSDNIGNSGTVDGGMCGTDMKEFAGDSDEPFTITLRNGRGETETFNVYMDNFSYEISKRGTVDFWNVDVTLVEV